MLLRTGGGEAAGSIKWFSKSVTAVQLQPNPVASHSAVEIQLPQFLVPHQARFAGQNSARRLRLRRDLATASSIVSHHVPCCDRAGKSICLKFDTQVLRPAKVAVTARQQFGMNSTSSSIGAKLTMFVSPKFQNLVFKVPVKTVSNSD